jgi:hypothetical protein
MGTHHRGAIGYVPGQVIVTSWFRQEVAQIMLLSVSAFLLDTVRVGRCGALDAQHARIPAGASGFGRFLDESVLDTMKAMSFMTSCAACRASLHPGLRR